MEPRKIIRTDIAASAIAHLTLVALIIVISEVHPFHSAPPETVAVDIVTPEQVKQEEAKAEEKAEEKAKEKPPEPLPELRLPKLDFNDKPDAALKPMPAKEKEPQSSPQKQASHEPQQKQPQPSQAPSQQPPPQPLAQQPPPAMSQQQAAPPAYRVPEPDVTVKYGVMLGLPPELPLQPKDAPKDALKDDGGDAKDSIGAKLPPEVIAELRRHLRSCSKLPAGVAPTDAVRIKLRAVMATDGTLARPPILIEAPPSAKGVAIVESAKSALQACQPYKMLPVDKYEEWKVMDLSFTPGDFGS
jgi:outer membrane biosynthesis protein TonB